MTYNPNIPAANDRLNQSQQDILDNFTKADSSFGEDHFRFSDGTADNGKHQHVRLPVKSGGTPPTTASGEGAIYTVANSGTSDLYYCRDNEATNVYQMTRIDDSKYTQFATNTAITNGNGGWTFLPGGLLLQYGIGLSGGTVATDYNATITFPKTFTMGCYSFVCSPIGSSTSYIVYSSIPTTSTVYVALKKRSDGDRVSGQNFSWWAIGV